MAYGPTNARSEFVLLNCADGCVFESSRMFHSAWPAFHKPDLRPTRGSGFGAPGERLSLGAPAWTGPGIDALEEPGMPCVQPAPMATTAARDSRYDDLNAVVTMLIEGSTQG